MYTPTANMAEILQNFTQDIQGVIDMIDELYSLIQDHSTKIRFTKINIKLKEAIFSKSAASHC